MTIINVKGTIIPNSSKEFYDHFGIESTAPKDIVLPEEGGDIEVHINSGGGSVFAGSEIYTALKSYNGSVIVKVVGLAASAASVIAMAGDKVEISPTAQMMIHNVSTVSAGDHRNLRAEADVIENMNTSIANAYVLKTGRSEADLLDLMAKTTWFNAQQAVDNGFADKIMFQDESVPQFVAATAMVVPDEVIAEWRHQQKASDKDEMTAKLDDVIARVEKLEKATAEFTTITNIETVPEEKPNVAKSPFSKFV